MGIFMTSISQNIAQKPDIVANATRNWPPDAWSTASLARIAASVWSLGGAGRPLGGLNLRGGRAVNHQIQGGKR